MVTDSLPNVRGGGIHQADPERLADYAATSMADGRVALILEAADGAKLKATTTPDLAREIGDALFRQALEVELAQSRSLKGPG